VVRDALAESQLLVDHLVGVPARARAHELLRGAKLAPDHRQHVEPGLRLPFQECGDVGPVNLDRLCIVQGDGCRLVRRRREHGRQPAHLAGTGRVDDNLLVVLVDHDHLDVTTQDDVGLLAGIAGAVDPLAGREAAGLDVLGEHGTLVRVEHGKDRDRLEDGRITRHSTLLNA